MLLFLCVAKAGSVLPVGRSKLKTTRKESKSFSTVVSFGSILLRSSTTIHLKKHGALTMQRGTDSEQISGKNTAPSSMYVCLSLTKIARIRICISLQINSFPSANLVIQLWRLALVIKFVLNQYQAQELLRISQNISQRSGKMKKVGTYAKHIGVGSLVSLVVFLALKIAVALGVLSPDVLDLNVLLNPSAPTSCGDSTSTQE